MRLFTFSKCNIDTVVKNMRLRYVMFSIRIYVFMQAACVFSASSSSYLYLQCEMGLSVRFSKRLIVQGRCTRLWMQRQLRKLLDPSTSVVGLARLLSSWRHMLTQVIQL